MSICTKYIKSLLNEVFEIRYEDIQEEINNNCRKTMQKYLDSMALHLEKRKEISDCSVNRVYKYVADIRKKNNYIPIINDLKHIENFILTSKNISQVEKNTIREINNYIDKDLNCVGFSVSSVSRIFLNENISTQKIDIFKEYLFIPMMLKKKELYKCYIISTNAFLEENRSIAKLTPYRDGYDALIMNDYNMHEIECVEYVRTVFTYLEKIDNYTSTRLIPEMDVWKYFEEYVMRACKEWDYITDYVVDDIKNGVIQELIKEKEFYERVFSGEKNVLEESNFQCIGLYHISHMFLKYMNKEADKNSAFYVIAMRLCSFAASKYKNFLHPMSTINAPCGLSGEHIFVGAGSVIGSGCYLSENVIIAGCPDMEETREVSTSTVTTIGEKTTIKRNAMLVAGVSVGEKCVIDENAILVRGTFDDKMFVKSDSSRENLWKKRDYRANGGYDYEEESR